MWRALYYNYIPAYLQTFLPSAINWGLIEQDLHFRTNTSGRDADSRSKPHSFPRSLYLATLPRRRLGISLRDSCPFAGLGCPKSSCFSRPACNHFAKDRPQAFLFAVRISGPRYIYLDATKASVFREMSRLPKQITHCSPERLKGSD
jgi:hypothetical protein